MAAKRERSLKVEGASARQTRPSRGSRPAKRIPVMGGEGDVWDDVCKSISKQVGAKVSFAAASRAIWAMVVEIEDSLGLVEAPQLERPANADALGNADFEDQLKEYIRAVIVRSSRR